MGLGKKLGLAKSKKPQPPQAKNNSPRKGSDAAGPDEDTKVAEVFLDCVAEGDEETVPDVVQDAKDAQFHCIKSAEDVASGYGSSEEPPWQLMGSWLQRAKEELHEDPDRTPKDLDRMRELIQSDDHLNARTDDGFLIRFLRARKFNVATAFKTVQRYYQMKQKHPQLFRVDHTERLLEMMCHELHGVLDGRDKNGCRVLVIRIDKWDSSVLTVDDFFRLNVVALEQVVREPETQVAGLAVIVDLAGFGLQHAQFLSPYYTKNTIDVVQIRLHGQNYGGLMEHMPAEMLPVGYGGPVGGFDFKRWHDSVLALEGYFQNMESYGWAEPGEADVASNSRRQSKCSEGRGSAPSSRRQSQAEPTKKT